MCFSKNSVAHNCRGKIQFIMANYKLSRQKQKQLFQFKIHHGKSKTVTAKANQEWRSAVVQVRGVVVHDVDFLPIFPGLLSVMSNLSWQVGKAVRNYSVCIGIRWHNFFPKLYCTQFINRNVKILRDRWFFTEVGGGGGEGWWDLREGGHEKDCRDRDCKFRLHSKHSNVK